MKKTSYEYWTNKFLLDHKNYNEREAINYINGLKTLPTQKIVLASLNDKLFKDNKITGETIEWKPHLKKQAKVFELDKMNDIINDVKKVLDLKERIAIAIGFLTGARLSEISKIFINWYSNNLSNEVEILGKGNKIRKIYLCSNLIEILNKSTIIEYNFFQKGERTISNAINNAFLKYGYDDGYTTHSLRRSFATNLFDSYPDKIVLVKNLLGHESLSTTIEYIGVKSKDYLNLIESSFDSARSLINDVNYKQEYMELNQKYNKALKSNFELLKIREEQDETIAKLLSHIANENQIRKNKKRS